MALSRVQATPKVTTSAAPTLAIPFTTPPTVGNGIIVPVSTWSGGPITGATDNYGNTYTLGPTIQQGGIPRASILYCPKVVATGASFTITVSAPFPYWTANAIEVAGVGSGLVIEQSATLGNPGSSAPSSGATPTITVAEVFLVAVLAVQSFQSGGITVESVSPSWVEEFEELPGSRSPGEADSRVLTSATGTLQSCNWTLGISDVWAALIVAFKTSGVGPAAQPVTGATRASALQLYAPTVSLPPVPVAATQLIVETLNVVPSSPLAATLVAAETLDANPNEARVTLLACELIIIAYEPPACTADAVFPIDPD